MTNRHLVRVNKAIQSAQALIDIGQEVQEPDSSLKKRVLAESVLRQFGLAITLYFRELAENYDLKTISDINTLNDLCVRFERSNKSIAEAQEFRDLSIIQNSWFNVITELCANLQDSLDGTPPAKSFITEGIIHSNRIEVVDITNTDQKMPEIDLNLLKTWLEEFKLIIFRHRQTSIEY